MLFQLVENTKDVIVFTDDKFVINPDFNHLTHTWQYSPYLDNSTTFASLLVGNKTLLDVCPEQLKPKFKNIISKHKTFLKTYKKTKISINDFELLEIFPKSFLKEMFEIQNEITKNVLLLYNKPKNYDFLVNLSYLIFKIKNKKIKINTSHLDIMLDTKSISLRNKFKNIKPYINYNIFGSITGRLASRPDSFPILNLNKMYRKMIEPNNNFFIELDYNGAELRTFLGLNEIEQPLENLHSWHLELYNKEYPNDQLDRETFKNKFLAWFYNGKNDIPFGLKQIDETYNKNNVIKKYWNGLKVETPFGREILSDQHHALSYIVQSVSNDLFLRQAIEVNKYIEENNLKSNISFLIHDALVIDTAQNELKHLKNIKEIFSNTKLGKFRVNIKIGKNFGEMREI